MAQSNVVELGDEALQFVYETGHPCAECEDPLILSDAVVLVQIVIPQLDSTQQIIYPAFESEGAYVYEPHFLHSFCWSELEERLIVLLDEESCAAVQDQYAFRVCDACKSGLRLLEPVAMITVGEFQRSGRWPNGSRSLAFSPYGNVLFYCLSCIRAVNEEFLEMWDSISYQGECPTCTYQRIWRNGSICTHERDE